MLLHLVSRSCQEVALGSHFHPEIRAQGLLGQHAMVTAVWYETVMIECNQCMVAAGWNSEASPPLCYAQNDNPSTLQASSETTFLGPK